MSSVGARRGRCRPSRVRRHCSTEAIAAVGDVPVARRPPSARSTRCCKGLPGRDGARRPPSSSSTRSSPASISSTPSSPSSSAQLEVGRPADADELEAARRRVDRLARRALGGAHDRLRTAREVAAARRSRRRRGRAGRLPGDPAGVLGARSARGARPRLGRHPCVRARPRARPRRARRCRRSSGSVSQDPTFQSGSVRVAGDVLSFVYKAAAEIGELGDNTARAPRAASPAISCCAARSRRRRAAHRRARPHPVGERRHHLRAERPPDQQRRARGRRAAPTPYLVAALNGDVDNHADLRVEHQLADPPSHHHRRQGHPGPRRAGTSPTGHDEVESFRRTVGGVRGLGRDRRHELDRLPARCCSRCSGSGQGLYVGLADDCFIVASEPYGVVEETMRYLRLDGEHGGEIVVLDAGDAGELAGIRATRLRRRRPAGHRRRDRHRRRSRPATSTAATAPHFLLKEITESPRSMRKTLRGKIVERDGMLRAVGRRAGAATRHRRAPGRRHDHPDPRDRPGHGGDRRPEHGGADRRAERRSTLDVDAVLATELSGFQLRLDMSDTLAIAVSQSGTTTDTNRTVDLLRGRGAAVIGIVNRRGSDLVDKADGVLFTSDGRDIEMSVASTKAFYAQVAAGALLACAITEAAGVGSRPASLASCSRACATCPRRWSAVLRQARRDRRRGPPVRAFQALLGGGRQRAQQGRRRGGSDQAQRALLQVDRRRRHRGQEAHRPVVRAADPRVCGRACAAARPTTSPRRRRSSGPTRRPRS